MNSFKHLNISLCIYHVSDYSLQTSVSHDCSRLNQKLRKVTTGFKNSNF